MTPWENHVTPRFTILILQSSTPDINNQMDFSIWIFCGSKNGQTKQEFHLSVPTFEQHTTCVDCKEISCNQHLLDDTPAWCQLPSLAYPGNPVYGAIVKPTKAVPQSVTPIWAPQDHHGFTDTGMGWSRSSAAITPCCCCNWKKEAISPWWWWLLRPDQQIRELFGVFSNGNISVLCDWDIYGFCIGSGPFGSRQCCERWVFHTDTV